MRQRFVGWYLIAPPVRWPKNEYAYVDWRASYHDWKVIYVLKTENECEAIRRAAQRSAKDQRLILFPGSFRGKVDETDLRPWIEQQAEVECIASDDPRLKSN